MNHRSVVKIRRIPVVYVVVQVSSGHIYTECLQKNGAVSKGNKKFISHLT